MEWACVHVGTWLKATEIPGGTTPECAAASVPAAAIPTTAITWAATAGNMFYRAIDHPWRDLRECPVAMGEYGPSGTAGPSLGTDSCRGGSFAAWPV
jgi:hypothetical protein